MFCYVYILHSASNQSFYVGITNNLQKRIAEHNNGLNFSTKPYIPWTIVYFEAHSNENDAKRREKYLKTSHGKLATRRMLREKLTELKNLSNQKVYY